MIAAVFLLAVTTKAGLNSTSRRTLLLKDATYETYAIELYDEFENDQIIESLFFDNSLWDETNGMLTAENEIIIQRCTTYHGEICLCNVRGETHYCSTVQDDNQFYYEYEYEYEEWAPSMFDPDVFAKMVDSAVSVVSNVKARECIVEYFKKLKTTSDQFKKMSEKDIGQKVVKAVKEKKEKLSFGAYKRFHAAVMQEIAKLFPLSGKDVQKSIKKDSHTKMLGIYQKKYPEFIVKTDLSLMGTFTSRAADVKFHIGNRLKINYALRDPSADKTWQEIVKFGRANLLTYFTRADLNTDTDVATYRTMHTDYLKTSKYKLTLAEYLMIRFYTSDSGFCFKFRALWRTGDTFDISPMQYMLSAFWRALHKPERITAMISLTKKRGTNLYHGSSAHLKHFLADFEVFNLRKKQKMKEIQTKMDKITDAASVEKKRLGDQLRAMELGLHQMLRGPLSTTSNPDTADGFGGNVLQVNKASDDCQKLMKNKAIQNVFGFLPYSEVKLIVKGSFLGEMERIWMDIPLACLKVIKQVSTSVKTSVDSS